MSCPNCRVDLPAGLSECPACGLIFAKWKGPTAARSGSPTPEKPGAEALSGDELRAVLRDRAWGAVCLSFVVAGLGHAHLGRHKRAALFFFGFGLSYAAAAWTLRAMTDGDFPGPRGLIVLSYLLLIVVARDAYSCALVPDGETLTSDSRPFTWRKMPLRLAGGLGRPWSLWTRFQGACVAAALMGAALVTAAAAVASVIALPLSALFVYLTWQEYHWSRFYWAIAGGKGEALPSPSEAAEAPRRFNVVELAVVVIFLGGLLGLIAVPKFFDLIRKATEGASKGNLGAVRSALSIYYGDLEGHYPRTFPSLTVDGKYLSSVPGAKTPNYHPDSSAVLHMTDAMVQAGRFTDAGGWAYVTDGPNQGAFMVNCTHTDTRGNAWTDY